MYRCFAKIAAGVATFSATVTLAGCTGESTSPCDKASATAYPARNDDCVTIAEGLWGDVWFWDGDFMPVCPDGTVTPAIREIRIHELATLDDVTPGPRAAFYAEVNTPLVATVQSDRLGFFQAELPPGTYSVFAVEDTLLYSNGYGGAGEICPVEVLPGQVTAIRFDITWRASF
jgi:hypothetical protein